jgi:hypothetical protein
VDLAQEPDLVVAGVVEAVRGTGRHGDRFARTRDQLVVAYSQAKRTFEYLKPL